MESGVRRKPAQAATTKRGMARHRIPAIRLKMGSCDVHRAFLLAVLLVTGCPTNLRADGDAAGDKRQAGSVFNPRGSFVMTTSQQIEQKWSKARDDEFHPRKSYSQQLLAMMKMNMSLPSALPEGPLGIKNNTSVQELANTLLADPMSLFRRRKRLRGADKGPASLSCNASSSCNSSPHTVPPNFTNATNATGAEAEVSAKNDGLLSETKTGGIQRLTLPQREALVKKWGVEFEQLEEEAFALFGRLHSANTPPVGRLTKSEFAGALRLMGADQGKEPFDRLLHFMFEAIDLERTGSIGFPEFVEWLLLITSENVEDRLRWGFQICDVRATGRITHREVTALIRLMFGVLTGLELDHRNPYVGDLVSSLFANKSLSHTLSHNPAGSTAAAVRPDPPHTRSAPPSPVKSRSTASMALAAMGRWEEQQEDDQEEGEGAGEEGCSLSWEEYRRVCLASADVMTAVSQQPYRKGYYGDKQVARERGGGWGEGGGGRWGEWSVCPLHHVWIVLNAACFAGVMAVWVRCTCPSRGKHNTVAAYMLGHLSNRQQLGAP
jgi:Ca2+-binding EF-hand superfamily protein